MSEYNITKIQTLFGLALAKADAELNKSGFNKLQDRIKRHLDANKLKISARYIDERIHQQIKNCLDNERPKVSLKLEYLEELALFVNNQGFAHFEIQYANISQRIKLDDIQHFPLRISLVSDLSHSSPITTQLIYPGQLAQIRNQYIDLNSIRRENLELLTSENDISILLISYKDQEKDQELFDLLKDIVSQAQGLIPIWLDQSDITSPSIIALDWLTIDYLEILTQWLIYNNHKEQPQSDSTKKSTSRAINNAGAVNLGKIGTIKAKYISARDMHINITENKSKK